MSFVRVPMAVSAGVQEWLELGAGQMVASSRWACGGCGDWLMALVAGQVFMSTAQEEGTVTIVLERHLAASPSGGAMAVGALLRKLPSMRIGMASRAGCGCTDELGQSQRCVWAGHGMALPAVQGSMGILKAEGGVAIVDEQQAPASPAVGAVTLIALGTQGWYMRIGMALVAGPADPFHLECHTGWGCRRGGSGGGRDGEDTMQRLR